MSIARAIVDYRRFTQGAFSSQVTFNSPTGEQSAIVRALISRHHLSVDPTTGLPVNARNVHITLAEAVLTDIGYITRNEAGEVSLRRHKVTFTDASAIARTYMIDSCMPSDTLGVLVCTLGDYASMPAATSNPEVG